jgi:O-methyltransferase involved in polyketide biosynthesis
LDILDCVTDNAHLQSRIDTSRPHTARIWNYWTGGKDNYLVDREAGDQIRRLHPGIVDYALADRLFLGRAVQHLAADVGIRQFLDIGTGLPSANNTHEVAQRAAPEARIVYVDNDPLVLAQARALLVGTPEGRTDYLDADLRDVDTVLERAAATLDFSQPVALMLLGVVIFIEDDEESYGIVRRLMDALPAGSHLVLSHTIASPAMPDVDAAVAFWNEHGTPRLTQRTPQQLTRYFDGLDMLEPGLVSCSRWRPEAVGGEEPDEVAMFGGVGRKS